jgi:Ca2+-binding EF-hand superfamily protein
MNQQNNQPPIGFNNGFQSPQSTSSVSLPGPLQQTQTQTQKISPIIGFADQFRLPQHQPNQPSNQFRPQHPSNQNYPQQFPFQPNQPSNQFRPQQSPQSIGFADQFNLPQHQPNQPLNQFRPQQPSNQNYPQQHPSQPQFPQNQFRPNNQFDNAFHSPQTPISNTQSDPYLTKVFYEFDVDRNNHITVPELTNALTRLNNNFSFDQKTIEFILKRFDSNNDRTITLNEFGQFFNYLNEEYEKFLIADMSGSGFIDDRELYNLLAKRGCNLNLNCIQYITQNLGRKITFDLFCRVNARFDYLCKTYSPARHGSSLDNFIGQTFFQDF